MQTHWSDLCMHFKFEFVHAFQDQENINIRITFFWGEKLTVHIHVLTKIFENLKVITLYSAVTKSELGNKMCMLTRSIQERKKKCTPEPANCPTYKSANSLLQVCSLFNEF